VAVKHDWLTGMGIDRGDQHRSIRPVLGGQPSGDGSTPLPLPGAVRRRIHFERRRTDSAARVNRILGGGSDPASNRPTMTPINHA
jgi:hypothetical protein